MLIAGFVVLATTIYVLNKLSWLAWRYGSPEETALRLGEQDLTIVDFGRRTHWSGNKISGFRPDRSLLPAKFWDFDPPARPDSKHRLWPWRRPPQPGSRQARRIGDNDDKPIGEIGERLKAFQGLTRS